MYSIVRVALLVCSWALHVKAQGTFLVTSPPAGIVLNVGQSVQISWDITGIPANTTTSQLGWRTGSRESPIVAAGTIDVVGINPHLGTYDTVVPQLPSGTYYYCVDAYGTWWGISQGFTVQNLVISTSASAYPISTLPPTSSSAPSNSSSISSSAPSSHPSSHPSGSSSTSGAIMVNSSLSSSFPSSATTLAQSSTPTSNPTPTNLTPIIGGSVAAFAAVIVVAAGFVFYKRRYKQRDELQTKKMSKSDWPTNNDYTASQAENYYAESQAENYYTEPFLSSDLVSQQPSQAHRFNYEAKNSAPEMRKPDERNV